MKQLFTLLSVLFFFAFAADNFYSETDQRLSDPSFVCSVTMDATAGSTLLPHYTANVINGNITDYGGGSCIVPIVPYYLSAHIADIGTLRSDWVSAHGTLVSLEVEYDSINDTWTVIAIN